jgi:putative intracellular protease/amidase
MFGVLKSLLKATAAVVDIPGSIAAEIVTRGGVITDQDKPYTAKADERLVRNVSDAASPDDENE